MPAKRLLNKEGERKVVIATRNSHNGIRVFCTIMGLPCLKMPPPTFSIHFTAPSNWHRPAGLAIVRRLLELHHGRVTAASDPDQGELYGGITHKTRSRQNTDRKATPTAV